MFMLINSVILKLPLQMPREDVMMQSPKFGIIVELDANGKIIRSLQDPSGHVYRSVPSLTLLVPPSLSVLQTHTQSEREREHSAVG